MISLESFADELEKIAMASSIGGVKIVKQIARRGAPINKPGAIKSMQDLKKVGPFEASNLIKQRRAQAIRFPSQTHA